MEGRAHRVGRIDSLRYIDILKLSGTLAFYSQLLDAAGQAAFSYATTSRKGGVWPHMHAQWSGFSTTTSEQRAFPTLPAELLTQLKALSGMRIQDVCAQHHYVTFE